MSDNYPELLSPNFTLHELTRSETARARGIDNTPPLELLPNALWLAQQLEDVRHLLGCKPIHINSGFRSLALHRAIYWRNPDAAPKTSAHLQFLAADFMPPEGMDMDKAFNLLAASDDIHYDQLIMETNGSGSSWIHLGLKPLGVAPRRQVLRGTGDPGKTKFASIREQG